MLTAIAIIALVLSSIAFGLSLGNSARLDSDERERDTKQLIRSSIDRCTQSQIKHITDWIKDVDAKLKAQEQNNG